MQTPLWYAEREQVFGAKELHPLEVPILSIQERDRRWAALREKMYLHALEGLVLFGSDFNSSMGMANVRYLTQIGVILGAYAIFPLVGEPIVFYGAPHMHMPGPWRQVPGGWVQDVRPKSGVGGVLGGLQELGLEGARLGVIGYRDMLSPESNLPAFFLEELHRGLPRATISDATPLVDELRTIKSTEEIEFLRRAGQIARRRIERLAATARPGATEAELHGAEVPHTATMRRLQEGDLVVCEFHTSYGGYLAGTEFSVFLGEAPEELVRVHDAAGELVRMAGDLFVPGRPLREISNAFHGYAEEAGLDFVELGFHGHGLASPEFPAIVYREADNSLLGRRGLGDVRLRENMVFGLNIDLHDPSWRRDVGIQLGDMVRVTPAGAEYLCDIPLDLFELPAD
jgi:Xaa-Pro aminopeptidase